MGYEIQDLMQLIVSERGSAVHLYVGSAPILEISRQLHRVEGPPLEDDEPQRMLLGIAPAEEQHEFERSGVASFDYEWRGPGSSGPYCGHFHVMAFHDHGHARLELRRFIDDDKRHAA